MPSSFQVTYKETAAFEPDTDRYGWGRDPPDGDRTCSITFQDLESLRTSNKALQDALAALDINSQQLLPTIVNAARTSCAQTQTLLDSLWSIIPAGARPSGSSAKKAMEVFRVPELLEQILLDLSPQELLRVQEVGRDWRDAVNGSGKLLRKLGLGPVEAAFYHSPLPSRFSRTNPGQSLPGVVYIPEGKVEAGWHPFVSEYSTDLNPMSNDFHAKVNVSIPTPKLGSRRLAMQICLPPPKTITVVAEYTIPHEYGRSDTAKLSLLTMANGTALTMGRLFRIINDALRDPDNKLPAGTSLRRVRVDLLMTLVDEDPVMKDRHKQMDFAVEWSEGKKRRRRRRVAKGMGDYESGSDFEEVSSVEG